MSKSSVNPKDDKVPPGQRRGHSLVPGSAAPHARFAKTKPAALLRPTGTVPTLTAKQAGNKTASKTADKARKPTKKAGINPPRG